MMDMTMTVGIEIGIVEVIGVVEDGMEEVVVVEVGEN